MKKAVVLGGGGFIGNHLVSRLKAEGYWVRAVDLHEPKFSESAADHFVIGDLREKGVVEKTLDQRFDEVYQLAADMGGAGFIFTGDNDSEIMHNSALINLHVAKRCVQTGVGRLFYSSSACIYPEHNQLDPNNPIMTEASAYPAAPDSEYGWEKLFSERLFLSFARNHHLPVRIARFHNIFGPLGEWTGGREKSPAAICRKVATASDGGQIELWGDGKQTRSFLYVDECVEGILRLTHSDFLGPVNLGSEEMISMNDLAAMVMEIAGKKLTIRHVPGPQGVRGRTSDNRLIRKELGWEPTQPLRKGMIRTYRWVRSQVEAKEKVSLMSPSLVIAT